MANQVDIFRHALDVVKSAGVESAGDGADDQLKLNQQVKQLCAELPGNAAGRKKVKSLVANYLNRQEELRRFRKAHRLNPKKQQLSKTMVDLMLTDLFYSRQDSRSLFEHLPEYEYLRKFDEAIAEHRASVQLPPLPEKQPRPKRPTKAASASAKRAKPEPNDPFFDQKTVPVKYLRVNRIKTDLDRVARELVNKHELVLVGGRHETFTAFLRRLFALKENELMPDYHFPDDLLVVHQSRSGFLQSLRVYAEGEVIFQDKACLLVTRCVPLEQGARIGDICCAPGMKTAAIASILNNKCELLSVDQNEERLASMHQMMEKLGVTCSEVTQADFTACKPAEFGDLDVMFLDPSCSGSGMLKRGDEKNDDKARLMKLASFQSKLVCHAMSLRPRHLVYSTCSNSIWENEFVVSKALEQAANGADYELVEAFPEWPQRGNPGFTCHPYVLRTGPNRGTQGFFCAVFRRVN